MRFLIDAQLPPKFVLFFQERGYVVEHVSDIGMGAATDSEIWDYAIEHHAVIVSKDQDFAMRAIQARKAAPVIWIRLGNTRTVALLSLFESIFPEIIDALNRKERLIEVN